MGHFGAKLFLFTGVVLLAGSHFVIRDNAFAAVMMRWMGFLALALALVFRD
ncbi:MAG: hypothetical protein HUU25_01025 [Candidatus Sumerlaeia bacterium]|nr:hypothetical protein [Candidatus Sumerlaeia bacterium]